VSLLTVSLSEYMKMSVAFQQLKMQRMMAPQPAPLVPRATDDFQNAPDEEWPGSS